MCRLWKVFVFEDRARSTESLQSEGDTTFDLLFLRGGIHALTEGGRCNDLTSSISLLSLVVGSSTSPTKLMKGKKKNCTCPIHAS